MKRSSFQGRDPRLRLCADCLASHFVWLHVGKDWVDALAATLEELERWGETRPTLLLPDGHDPAACAWPVRGRNVAIYGCLDALHLRRLLAVLLKHGAFAAAGLDTDGTLHTAVRDAAEARP